MSIDGGRTSLIQGTTDMCEEKLFLNNEMGHISTNIFVLLWVVIGDQELLSVHVMVDGKCSGTSHGFMTADYAEAGKAAGS